MWTSRLSPEQADDVRALAGRAAASDGTGPLNEEAHFALRDDTARHLLAHRGDALVGYLQWQPGYRTAQLVVDPAHRRLGVGRGLVAGLDAALRDARPSPTSPSGTGEEGPPALAGSPGTGGTSWGVWAFGDLPAAQGFAAALGWTPSRGLLVMERDLAGVGQPRLPAGFTVRGYDPSDAAPFLALNAAAFAHHPEQGALDAAGLAARTAEPWFDPGGLLLGFDADGLAGFHWTKLVDGVGEVYVLGVAPRAQGHGYGKVLLQAGLAHLRAGGAGHVVLYVDIAEPVAVRMYESAGFHVAHRDVLYASEHGFVQKQEQP